MAKSGKKWQTKKNIECQYCGKQYTSRNGLWKHSVTEKGQKGQKGQKRAKKGNVIYVMLNAVKI